MKNLWAEDVPEAFREMKSIAKGTRADNYFYTVSMNPRAEEHLTPEQWDLAVDRLEHNLGLDGHARFQVEHEKADGRVHRHIVWSRVDPDTMTVTPAKNDYYIHMQTGRELEREFNHQPTPDPMEHGHRAEKEFSDWELFRGQDGRDPKEVKAEVTALWKQSDNGAAFVAALEDSGYTLCQGDRGYCIIDQYGDSHSLVRRLEHVKTAELREYLSDTPLASLPTVAEASAAVRAQSEQEEAESGDSSGARVLPQEQQAQLAQPAPDPRAAWFAENLPEAYPIAATARDYAELVEAHMRANDCELPLTQGRTWDMWAEHALHYFQERASSLSEKMHDLPPELQERLDHLTDTVTQVKDRLNTFWQDFVKEGREREPPEMQEPELER